MTGQAALLVVAALGCAPGPVRVMSFNIRYANPNDAEHGWDNRRAAVCATIRARDPDLLGVQEALVTQVGELRAALPEYGFVGVGRDDGAAQGEFVPLFYRRERFQLVDAGHFWLSENPEQAGSVGWDAALPRLATWARLRFLDAPWFTVHVVNVHLDHEGPRARLESARLLRRLAEAGGREALIILGDFNCPPDSPPHRLLASGGREYFGLRDAHEQRPSVRAEEGTYHGFTGRPRGGRIDWILFNRRFEAEAADVDRTDFDGRFPSDHFPVTATLRWTGE